ncbi:MAG: hypothetical protein OEZ36_10880 [Spirochaetota bacterium]|nr:hypothetical protein [Spirochaetota bacterium]
MSLKPLDIQVVIGQSDHAGKNYLKHYLAPRKDQIHHELVMQQRARDGDQKVLDLPEEISDYQETYLDPHDERRKRFKNIPVKASDSDTESAPLTEEIGKGNLIDIRQ